MVNAVTLLELLGVSSGIGTSLAPFVLSGFREIMPSPSALHPDSCTNPGTEAQELPPEEEKGTPSPVQASSSFFPDEMVMGSSNLLPQDNFKAH